MAAILASDGRSPTDLNVLTDAGFLAFFFSPPLLLRRASARSGAGGTVVLSSLLPW